jgi:hypothetical protein
MFQEAMNSASQVENMSLLPKVVKLQAAIKYGEDDLQNAKASTYFMQTARPSESECIQYVHIR